LEQSIKLNGTSRLLRTIDREMNDESLVKFIWNPTDQWLSLSFSVADTLKSIYWLDAASGNIIKAANSQAVFGYALPLMARLFCMHQKIRLTDQNYHRLQSSVTLLKN
jgi:hypothetical protein